VAEAPEPLPAAAPPADPPPPSPALVEAAGGIPDPELRARFLAAASRYLGRFAGDQDERAGAATGSSSG